MRIVKSHSEWPHQGRYGSPSGLQVRGRTFLNGKPDWEERKPLLVVGLATTLYSFARCDTSRLTLRSMLVQPAYMSPSTGYVSNPLCLDRYLGSLSINAYFFPPVLPVLYFGTFRSGL